MAEHHILPPAPEPHEPQGLDHLTELLRQRLLSGLYLGSMRAGARLPSLRQLARQYAVDVRLVRRAYQVLEHEGLVELRNRSGVFFAPAAERARAPLSPRAQWLINVSVDGLTRGISIPDLGKRVERYTSASDLRLSCIECNDDQAAALCSELTRAFGVKSLPMEIDHLLASPDPARELKDVDCLVTTPFHSGEVEELAARAKKPWLCMTPRADIFSEISKLLSAGPVHYAVADQRFADKLRKIFRNTSYGDRLTPLLVEEGDLRRAAPNVPLYVTNLARQQAGNALPDYARPSVCVFATSASRALLAFIVARNIDREDSN